MKWCVFVNRRCYGEDCSGWVKDNCFIYLLLPADYSGKELQTEFNWSKYGLSDTDVNDSPRNRNYQLTLLDELEKQITQRNSC
jgi:hypothetical protein